MTGRSDDARARPSTYPQPSIHGSLTLSVQISEFELKSREPVIPSYPYIGEMAAKLLVSEQLASEYTTLS